MGIHIQSGSKEKKYNVGVHLSKEIVLRLKLWDQEMKDYSFMAECFQKENGVSYSASKLQ